MYLNWRRVSSDHVLPLSESAVICRVFVALVPASCPRRARACYTIQSDSAISANRRNATQRVSKNGKTRLAAVWALMPILSSAWKARLRGGVVFGAAICSAKRRKPNIGVAEMEDAISVS